MKRNNCPVCLDDMAGAKVIINAPDAWRASKNEGHADKLYIYIYMGEVDWIKFL